MFIANQLTASGLDGSSMSGMKIKPTVLTKISYNGGGTWQPIKAPSKFNYQKCDRCGGAKECSLHLHGAWSGTAQLLHGGSTSPICCACIILPPTPNTRDSSVPLRIHQEPSPCNACPVVS